MLESMDAASRRVLLGRMEAALDARLAPFAAQGDFWRETEAIIGELKEIGYDLWLWSYDGDGYASWGGDYMRPDSASCLAIDFYYYDVDEGRVRISWKGQDEE